MADDKLYRERQQKKCDDKYNSGCCDGGFCDYCLFSIYNFDKFLTSTKKDK